VFARCAAAAGGFAKAVYHCCIAVQIVGEMLVHVRIASSLITHSQEHRKPTRPSAVVKVGYWRFSAPMLKRNEDYAYGFSQLVIFVDHH